jgi:hypothetical protein
MGIIEGFFKPLGIIEGITEKDQLVLDHYIKSLISISRMIDLSYYLIDYKKQGFIYVSDHPL